MVGRKHASVPLPAPARPAPVLDADELGELLAPGGARGASATEPSPSTGGIQKRPRELGLGGSKSARRSTLEAYLQQLRLHPLLSRDEEHRLAVRYATTRDRTTAERLITANLRLVVKLARDYRRVHRNLLDLIQEGNLGLMQAVEKYDPYRGVKLSSYAAWWIRAYILRFILANWRMVRIGTTQPQRKLFFNLRRERERLERQGVEVDAQSLAAALDVSSSEVVEMERRLAASETSLDAPVREGDRPGRAAQELVPAAATVQPDLQVEAGEFDQVLRLKLQRFEARLRDRELDLYRKRLLAEEPQTLDRIGEAHGISRERARQIEERLKQKLRRFLELELGDAIGQPPDDGRPPGSR